MKDHVEGVGHVVTIEVTYLIETRSICKRMFLTRELLEEAFEGNPIDNATYFFKRLFEQVWSHRNEPDEQP